VRGLEGHEGEIEGVFEGAGVSVGVESHPAFFAELVEQKAGIAHQVDVLPVSVEDGHAPHLAGHLRGRHAADGSGTHD
jgi:hypothetical protein